MADITLLTLKPQQNDCEDQLLERISAALYYLNYGIPFESPSLMSDVVYSTEVPQRGDGPEERLGRIAQCLAALAATGIATTTGLDTITDVRTGNFVATAKAVNPVDVTAGSVTVTPPAAVPGNWFVVVDSTAGSSANDITVNFTASKINGVSDTYVIDDTEHSSARFTYINGTVGWADLS